MAESDIIRSTKAPNTYTSLLNDFKTLGIQPGDIILVHSSLSSIGWVCGSERTVIDALLGAAGKEGTICMPAHSGENTNPADWSNPPVPDEWNEIIYESMPPYDPQITPTRGMGRVAELFRKYPGTLRSEHPQVSFCANGKHAKEITEKHVLTPQFGMDSPLGKLYDLNAKVLLLGVGYGNCTSFHMGEVFSNSAPQARTGSAVYVNKVREWKWFDDCDYDSDDFEKLGEDFEKHAQVMLGKAGNADCKLFDLKSGVNFAADWLKENREI